MKRLLASADGDDERLLVLLGAYGGLRAAEMVGLRWADVDLDAGRLVVKRGKRGKRHTIPLTPLLASALAAMARSSAFVLALEQERRTAGTAQIRYSAASSRLKRACTRAGVPPRGLDALRHSAGTRLNEQSGDVGLGVSILSYGGGVQFGVITDSTLCPDPQAIIVEFTPEFAKLSIVTMMLPWEE